ncbi:MAG: HD domain-containing protein, partial [Desulfosarcina sp.]|nr:HD domain-containing protein [Desulfobacterales bacterium]
VYRFSIPPIAFPPAAPIAYVGGGSVRDLLLGRQPVDLDIAVAEDPAGYARAIADRTGTRVVIMGKPGQTVFRVASRIILYDVTPLKNGRIEDDLRARDFTVNAMACDLQSFKIIDPLNGRRDMAARRLRMVAKQAFKNDPLRLLRAYRMAATLGFEIEAETRAAIKQAAFLICKPAGERIRAELLQLLASPDSRRLIGLMATDRLLTAIFPEMQAMVGCRQNKHHDYDVFDHTLYAYAALEEIINTAAGLDPHLAARYTAETAPATAMLKYAMLLHDIGKPETRTIDPDGRTRFTGHAGRSAQMAVDINQRLRLSRPEADQAEAIIRQHIRPLDLFSAHRQRNLSPRAIHRFFRVCDPWSVDILLHALGDRGGKRKAPPSANDGFTEFIEGLIHYYFETYRPALAAAPLLRGNDLIRHFGLKPGPAIGSLLDQVEEERLTGKLQTRQAALEFVRHKLDD